MKTLNRNRNKLVTARPRPLALEARIMFDGAGVDSALAAKHGTDALVREGVRTDAGNKPAADAYVPPADTSAVRSADSADATRVPALFDVPASATGLQEAADRATQAVRDYLAANPGDEALFQLFNGGQNTASQA